MNISPPLQDVGNKLLCALQEIYTTTFDKDIQTPWGDVSSALTIGRSKINLLQKGEKIAGFCIWTPIFSHNSIFIDYFCVSRAHQGKGVGRAFLSTILSSLEKQTRFIILDCKGNLEGFYSSLGFSKVGSCVWRGVSLSLMAKGIFTPEEVIISYKMAQSPENLSKL